MSAVARDLIALVRTVGGSLRVLDYRVRVEAPAPLSSELIDRPRAGKDEVLALVVSGQSGSSILADMPSPTKLRNGQPISSISPAYPAQGPSRSHTYSVAGRLATLTRRNGGVSLVAR
jgi:hypothetical protein